MGIYFVANQNMVTITCYKCAILFAVPKEFNDKQLALCEKGEFFCPNGHGQVYVGKSKDEIIQIKDRQLKNVQECCDHYQDEKVRLEYEIKKKDYRARHYKGEVTKLKRQGLK